MQAVKRNKVTKYILGMPVYLIHRHYEYKYGIHANTNIEVGEGLCIKHGDGVYLNCKRIGKNFTVYQGVTLGLGKTGIPAVADNVTVYTNAVVIGNVILNNGCKVGANAFVDKDVPAGCSVVGVPAKKNLKMKTILIINATAARSSGALTIIRDFMSYAYGTRNSSYHLHLLTTTTGIFTDAENVTVHELPGQSWGQRLAWDRSGFQKWCESNGIIPDVVVSFQNTCPRLTGALRAVKLLVYYHQQLPLVKYQWKWLRSDERKLFLYAHFYGFFVNRWNKNAEYVVQLPSVKELFCKKFPNIPAERVHVIRPNLPDIDVDSVPVKAVYPGKKVLIYPATPLRYKNHIVILRALDYLRKESSDTLKKIKVVFTVPKGSFVADEVHKMGLDSVVDCIGSIPYEELLSYYKRSDALLFPSKIESFGLPLIEAAMFGVLVVAADLPYAREVLENYEGVQFVDVDDYKIWAENIKKIILEEKNKDLSFKICRKNTWDDFLKLL